MGVAPLSVLFALSQLSHLLAGEHLPRTTQICQVVKIGVIHFVSHSEEKRRRRKVVGSPVSWFKTSFNSIRNALVMRTDYLEQNQSTI
jgi:hypothetical protein